MLLNLNITNVKPRSDDGEIDMTGEVKGEVRDMVWTGES